MADYHTNFSFIIHLPSPEARDAAIELDNQAREYDSEVVPHTLPVALVEVAEDWQFETDVSGECGLWLHSSNGGLDAACVFIQHLLSSYNPDGYVGFEWSHDCSKPRTDAYGGGAAFITSKSIKSMSTCTWLNEQRAKAKPVSPIGDTNQ